METILVVDDEKNYLLVLSAVLEEEGYEVLTTASGLEALEILKASDVDIARRTVAKYRESLGILPSMKRKNHF